MADQRRWFKVWTSLIGNARFAEMTLEDIGRWTLLGASTALDGDQGVLEVPGAGRELCRLLRVPDLDGAKVALNRLDSVRYEERKNNGVTAVVTWKNWKTYQEDTTQKQRQKASRAKRRGDEKRSRRDEKRLNPPIVPRAGGPEVDILTWLNQKAGKNFRPKETNLAFIRGRLADGIQSWQLKAIISRKTREWVGTERATYLRPSTLFNKTKCEQYLGELPADTTSGDAN